MLFNNRPYLPPRFYNLGKMRPRLSSTSLMKPTYHYTNQIFNKKSQYGGYNPSYLEIIVIIILVCMAIVLYCRYRRVQEERDPEEKVSIKDMIYSLLFKTIT